MISRLYAHVLVWSGLLTLAGCVPGLRRPTPTAPMATGGVSPLEMHRLGRGEGAWLPMGPRRWHFTWSGAEGAVQAAWTQALQWPEATEPTVWIGVTVGEGCGEAIGSVAMRPVGPADHPTDLTWQEVPTVATRGRALWAAAWLGAAGWPQAWRPTWVLEFAPSGQLEVRWASPPRASVAAVRATPCLAGWVAVPAAAYWMGVPPAGAATTPAGR